MRVRKLFDEDVEILNTDNSEIKTLENNIKMEKMMAGNILIMDDEQAIRDLLSLNLGMLGYATVQASNSDDAIGLYSRSLNTEKPIDALILDLNIPNSLGGEAVAKEIRKLNKNVKIVICSGDSTSPEFVNYKEHGFDGSLDKIFNREKIKQLFDRVLSNE